MAITTIDTTAPANTVLTASTVLPPPAVAGSIGRHASPGLPGGFVDPTGEFQIDTSQLPANWTPPQTTDDDDPTAGSVVIPTGPDEGAPVQQPAPPQREGLAPWVIPTAAFAGFALAVWWFNR
jgi:hypothetical protein